MKRVMGARKSNRATKRLLAVLLTLLCVLIGVSIGLARPQQQQRAFVAKNNVHPRVASGEAQFVRHMDPNTKLDLAIVLPLRNEQELTALLQQIYDPTSFMYRQFLSVEEFTARFGPTAEDYDAVVKYMHQYGMTVTATHPNRVVLDVNGTVPQIEKAFNVTLNLYRDPRD